MYYRGQTSARDISCTSKKQYRHRLCYINENFLSYDFTSFLLYVAFFHTIAVKKWHRRGWVFVTKPIFPKHACTMHHSHINRFQMYMENVSNEMIRKIMGIRRDPLFLNNTERQEKYVVRKRNSFRSMENKIFFVMEIKVVEQTGPRKDFNHVFVHCSQYFHWKSHKMNKALFFFLNKKGPLVKSI